jgi:hypothetical protein
MTDRTNSIENNRLQFAKMNLKQRTLQRKQLQEMMALPTIMKKISGVKKADEDEAKELIKIIDDMNLQEVLSRRGPRNMK